MSYNILESPGTLTSGSPKTLRKDSVVGKNNSSPKQKVSAKQQIPGYSPRFQVALRKALFFRSKFLGRRLTRAEFLKLSAAVKKQISRKFSRLDAILSSIVDRISKLEKACPQSPLDLQDSIGMFAAQVSVLREQALHAITERDEISETCGHFSKKKLFYPKSFEPFVLKFNGLDMVQPMLHSKEMLACQACTNKREEAVFYWTGTDASTFQNVIHGSRGLDSVKEANLLKVAPLAIQDIWTQVLNNHYQRTWSTPATS
jgi:hypothetical protein